MYNQSVAAVRVARVLRRLDLLKRYHDSASAAVAARIVNAIRKLYPERYEKLFSRPVAIAGPSIIKAQKATAAPINHMEEERAASRALFTDWRYDVARHVVAGKIKGARRRGVSDNNNVYISNYAEMLQVAAVALEECYMEAAHYAATVPPQFIEEDYWNSRETPFLTACRACGKHAYWIEKRVKEGTPIEHVSNHSKENGAIVALAENSAVNTWKARAVEYIAMQERCKAITAKQAANMRHIINGNIHDVKQPDVVRKFMLRMFEKGGLLKRDVRGGLNIAE